VIVPLYNKALFVLRCLDSIFAQTFGDFELIVVDDGSTDEGADLVSRIDDTRVRLIRQANAGPGAARNRGLAEAVGEYVAFLDADDEWQSTFLEKSLACLSLLGPQVASVSWGYTLFPSGQSTEPMWRNRGLIDCVYTLSCETVPLLAMYLLAFLTPCNTLARTATIRRWGGFFDEGRCVYAEDSFLWLKVLLNESVAVRMEPLVCVHAEASALSGNLRGPRPIEPMLHHPEQIESACPVELQPLLAGILELRAIKTASMLAYWGRREEGRDVLRRFCPRPTVSLARYLTARLALTPFGSLTGKILRMAASGLRERRPVPAKS
jgi:Glycosyl transferase family 2